MIHTASRATRALVLRSAGTNCDGETLRALERAGATATLRHLNELALQPELLARCQLLVLPGGFSYGDYVAAGRVFAIELRQRLAEPIARFVESGGPVLGICNGFQILTELGLLESPRLAPTERTLALTDNASSRFECRWVTLRVERCNATWLGIGECWPVPVAHGEGRFVAADE